MTVDEALKWTETSTMYDAKKNGVCMDVLAAEVHRLRSECQLAWRTKENLAAKLARVAGLTVTWRESSRRWNGRGCAGALETLLEDEP